jgi:hypothetical protein
MANWLPKIDNSISKIIRFTAKGRGIQAIKRLQFKCLSNQFITDPLYVSATGVCCFDYTITQGKIEYPCSLLSRAAPT